jgi:hypothetical protein
MIPLCPGGSYTNSAISKDISELQIYQIRHTTPDRNAKKYLNLRQIYHETFLAKYEINSINTNKGSKPKGQPEGTNKEKNFKPHRVHCRTPMSDTHGKGVYI